MHGPDAVPERAGSRPPGGRGRRRLARNFALVLVANVLQTGTRFVVLGLVTVHYGLAMLRDLIFVLYTARLALLAAQFGLNRIVGREVAVDRDMANVAVGTSLVIRWSVGLAAVAVMIGVAWALPGTFSPLIFWGLVLALASELLRSTADIFRWEFAGFERLDFHPVLNVITAVVLLTGAGLAAALKLSFLYILVAYVASSAARAGAAAVIAARVFGTRRLRFDRAVAKRYLREGLMLALWTLVVTMCIRMGPIVLKFLAGHDTALAPPHSLLVNIRTLMAALAMASYAHFTRQAAARDHAIADDVAVLLRVIMSISLCAVVAAMFLAEDVLLVIFRVKAVVQSSTPMRILMPALVLMCLQQFMSMLIIAARRERWLLVAGGVATTVQVAADVVLISGLASLGRRGLAQLTGGSWLVPESLVPNMLGLPAAGAAWGMLISLGLLTALTFLLVCQYVTTFSVRAVVVRPLVAGAAMAVVLVALGGWAPWAAMVAGSLAFAAVCASPREWRALVKTVARRRRAGPRGPRRPGDLIVPEQ